MDLLQNPFYILNASTRDNRRRIMELADERSLLLDSNQCMEARSDLTNPRKRLSAEVAWLPGIGPKRVSVALSLVESSLIDLLAVDNMPSVARLNLLAAGLTRLHDHNADDVVDWILEIALAFQGLDPDELSVIINEERIVSGFPQLTDLSAVEAEIDERRSYYRQAIKLALDNLSPKELVKAVTNAVEYATAYGEELGPIIIDDLVDSYEVEAQEFLDTEEDNINALVEKLQTAVDAERPDSIISPLVNQLVQVVKNWDSVAQPIQVSKKSRGLDHNASQRVGGLVRNIAIYMFNEHGKLDFSQQLTNMLQEAFAEVGKVAERTAADAKALQEIATNRSQNRSEPSAPQQSVFALLELTKWPSIPAPWSSIDAGETWILGDFFFTFQKNPMTILDLTLEMEGKKAEYRGMIYHYAMSVFYRIDKSPHGSSLRPIMTITLEQLDMTMLSKIHGDEASEQLQAEGGSKMGPLMIGLFTAETRLNLGIYDDDINRQAVKHRFFEILSRQLGITGQSKMIGNLAEAHGHKDTGLPSRKKKAGCATMTLWCIGVVGLGAYGLPSILGG